MADVIDCPNCDGSGVIDTSPPAVFRAPWLASDAPCPECDGKGEVPAHLYVEPDDEETLPPDPAREDPWS